MLLKLKFRILYTCLLLIFFSSAANAAHVDSLTTYSTVMKKNIKSVVILPEGYEGGKEFPVVYLLHGYSDTYSKWIKTVPAIKDHADRFKMIIVCPDGNFDSWYFDSPVDPKIQYETYLTKELLSDIDRKYKTVRNRKGRAITGLSMGGHGALYIAIKHPDLFAAAGSMSGGVDIRPFSNNWGIKEKLGVYDQNPARWSANTIMEMTHLIRPGQLALIIDCGKEDFFYPVNVALHEKLRYNNVPHDFIIRPGEHNWAYWANSITFQLLYFNNFFNNY